MNFAACTPQSLRVPLPDEAATLELGRRLSIGLAPGMKVYVSGDLGTGKTTLVRGVLRALGYTGHVRSPTFTLVELYRLSRLYLYHYDFYRFIDPQEWQDSGFREQFSADAVCVVEWPEKAYGQLPAPDLGVRLEHLEADRVAELVPYTEAGRRCVRYAGLAI